MTERRLEARALCADLVTLGWIEASGFAHAAPVVLEDISPRGACLQSESPVRVNSEAFVQHGEWIIRGVVSYCNFREIGFYIGVKFEDGAKWSQEEFSPQHLLDVASLASSHLRSR
jgi:hypothetical protein